PVEDDEVADQGIDMPDPVAHLAALVRRRRAKRRIGKALVEIFADRAALMQRPSVMDQRRDHAEWIDPEIFGRMVLHPGHVDDMALVGEALLLKAEPDPARSAGSPAVVKDHHWFPPYPCSCGGNQSLGEMRRQWMIGGLVEESRFLGGRLQQLLILVIDV